MIQFLRRLFSRPERHYIASIPPVSPAVCKCGHTSYWDYDLRKHFTETGRIGK